jgi:hypothetical protein
VGALRSQAQAYLVQGIASVPATVGCHGTAFRMRRAAGMQPSASLLDLLRAASLPPAHLRTFNPFLSEASCTNLHQGLLVWLQLCVLEDRLSRLQALAQAASKDEGVRPLLLQELMVHRTWEVSAHPLWLVFEAEGQLQVSWRRHAATRKQSTFLKNN